MSPDITNIAFIIFKFFVLFGFGLYLVCRLLIFRQEQLMANVLEESFEPVLRFAAGLHFIAALAVFLLALLIL